MSGLKGNAVVVVEFLASAPMTAQPQAVSRAASNCLIDWLGVAIAGAADNAAFVNGGAVHALDFDDTHIPTNSHLFAVTWAALLALAKPGRDSGQDLLRAFVAGYEVAAKLAGRRMWFSLQFCWFYPTAVLGRVDSAEASVALLKLNPFQSANAVALSPTMAGGLCASSGGMGKPLQAGFEPRDGVTAALLVRAGA